MKTRASVDRKMIRDEAPDRMVPGTLLQAEPQKWEYKTIVASDTADLNELASKGWELIAVKARPADQAVFYFRRQIL